MGRGWVGAVIHHVFKQWRGGPGCAGLMTGFRSCRLSGRIRLAALGHLERRGHIAHIKGGRESRSPRLTTGQRGKSGGLARRGTRMDRDSER